jgi:hypothetical protein
MAGGGRMDIGFNNVYQALDVEEHRKIFRMAAEEIIIQFPMSEVEQAQREA